MFHFHIFEGVDFTFRSPRSVKNWLGRRGLKLVYALPAKVWIIYYPTPYDDIGYMTVEK